MKYMMLMSSTKAEFDAYVNWPREDLAESVSFMRSFAKELEDTGALVLTMGLGFPNEAKLVRAGADGDPVTDGVFPESKEFLAGFWIIDVEGPEEAYRIAAKASAGSPSLHKKYGSQPIEIRRLMDSAPQEWQ